MSDNLTHRVSFKRTKNLGNFNSVTAEVAIEFSAAPDASMSALLAQGESIWNAQAAAVFDRLGLEYEIDPDSGEVTEALPAAIEPQLPAAPAAPSAGWEGEITESKVGPNAQGVGDTPPFVPDTNDRNEKALNKKWAMARLESHPNEFWDNREKKASGQYKENAADFTHKETRVAVWLS